MEALTVRISGKTTRGKYLIGLLKDMAKLGNDIQIEDMPNEETRVSIEDARKKKDLRQKM